MRTREDATKQEEKPAMKNVINAVVAALVLGLAAAELSGDAAETSCPIDSVRVGPICVDKYEGSMWHVSPEQNGLIRKIQSGRADLGDLLAGGAVQVGVASGDLDAVGCPITGNGCRDVYAVSIPDVMPAGFPNWFQAAAAARNSLKRLPTNQEWQMAALGTPDDAACNSATSSNVAPTGSASGCVSDAGIFDAVGNVAEWSADWQLAGSGCFMFPESFGSDQACPNVPNGFIRGGSAGLFGGAPAGVFATRANLHVTVGSPAGLLGFRSVRPASGAR
jgi:hypothetical protein